MPIEKKKKHIDLKNLNLDEKIFKKWIMILRKYHKDYDVPWYRERTQVGFFAAASWLANVPALEEWTSEKHRDEEDIIGRCDLWIKNGDFYIEAKHLWCPITGKLEKRKNRIQQIIDRCKESAGTMMCSKNHRLAFIFLGPLIQKHILQKKSDLDVDSLTSDWLKMVINLRSDAIAWFLPNRSKRNLDDTRNFDIGIVLLIYKV